MIQIVKVEYKKTMSDIFSQEVNRKIRNLSNKGFKIISTNIVETEIWDYPRHYPALCCLITVDYNVENKTQLTELNIDITREELQKIFYDYLKVKKEYHEVEFLRDRLIEILEKSADLVLDELE